MEDLMRELIDVIRETNGGLDWASIISAICSVISLTAIIILLKERREKKRPYLQASFELIRSSLTCIVIRNVGDVPAKLFGIVFNGDFIKQLPEKVQDRLKSKANTEIAIYPKRQLVISLDVVTADVLKFTEKNLKITIKYSSIEKKQVKYIEDSEIVFGDYEGFLIYISEIDELKNAIMDVGKSLDKITKVLEKSTFDTTSHNRIANCSSMEDSYSRIIATDVNEKGKGGNT
jgi:hypothetical protein